MAHLIDKTALVAEIKRLIEIANNNYAKFLGNRSAWAQQRVVCEKLLSFLDTLEVKEIGVDVGSPEGDLGRKTVQVIDADGYVKEIKIQKG